MKFATLISMFYVYDLQFWVNLGILWLFKQSNCSNSFSVPQNCPTVPPVKVLICVLSFCLCAGLFGLVDCCYNKMYALLMFSFADIFVVGDG